MLTPLAVAEVEDSPDPYRFEQLRSAAPDFTGRRLPYDYVEHATSADRSTGDSLHLLVMDSHRALNRLQAEIATETLDGASVYGIHADDRELIAAFMSGLRRTAPLKFDHPGLGTTATHVGGRLLIQNDIGMTEAHVLVVAVAGLVATVTYTDVHLARQDFFQHMLDRFDVDWSQTERRDGGVRLRGAPPGDGPLRRPRPGRHVPTSRTWVRGWCSSSTGTGRASGWSRWSARRPRSRCWPGRPTRNADIGRSSSSAASAWSSRRSSKP